MRKKVRTFVSVAIFGANTGKDVHAVDAIDFGCFAEPTQRIWQLGISTTRNDMTDVSKVVKFWDGQKWRFCPKCQLMAFEFAEAYAASSRAPEGAERTSAIAALEAEWLSQDKILEYRNWLQDKLLQSHAAHAHSEGVNGWVRTSERLPEMDGTPYLVNYVKYKPKPDEAATEIDVWTAQGQAAWYNFERFGGQSGITHYQALPAPPKESTR